MKLFNTLGLLLSAALSIHAPVHAQSFPNKPINLMVPYPAGGLFRCHCTQSQSGIGARIEATRDH